jgi:hypothetical protein
MTIPGTLAALIEDLEELHTEEYFEGEEAYQGEQRCGEDEQYWPCSTMEIVRKHKRATYLIVPASEPSESVEVLKKIAELPRLGETVYKGKTITECEQWIEKQVNDAH